jgi:hypothetical protein
VAYSTVYDFGRALLDENDLDPVYVALWEAKLEPDLLRRWLIAFWSFYHSGTSSWIADAPGGEEGYWDRMMLAASSKEYPRCHERRHFRGQAAIKAVESLRAKGLIDLFSPFREEMPCEEVMREVQRWYLFGPWIAFKMADMLERLDICKVDFSGGEMFLFNSPNQGARLLWEEEGKPEEGKGDKVGSWAVGRVLVHLNASLQGIRSRNGRIPVSTPIRPATGRIDTRKVFLAPPRYERPLNVQEAETVLCKFHSYRKGHYRVGEDVEGLRDGLLRFARCGLSQRLLRAGKVGGLWK